MRTVLQTLMLCCVASLAGALPAAAQDFPFCIKGCDFGAGRGDCSFSSYQQCQATASGRDAYCDANPNFSARAFKADASNAKAANAKAELQPDRGHLSKRRF